MKPISVILGCLLIGCSHAIVNDFLNSLGNTSPYLVAYCQPRDAPVNGRAYCSYSAVNLTCIATCNLGYATPSGARTQRLSCEITQAKLWGSKSQFDPCSLTVNLGTSRPTVRPVTPAITNSPVTSGNLIPSGFCVNDYDDCRRVAVEGDYPSCNSCHQFVSCAVDGAFLKDCPGNTEFDATKRQCEFRSTTCHRP